MKQTRRVASTCAVLSLTLGMSLTGGFTHTASAATSTTTVNGTAFGDAGLRMARSNCGDPVVPASGTFETSTAIDEAAPAGDRVLTVSTTSSTGVGPLAAVRQPQNLTSLRASVISTSGSDDIAAVVRYRPDASDSTWWGLAPLVAPVGSYGEVEASSSLFTWSRIGVDGTREASGGQRTIQDFFGTPRTPGRIHVGFLLGCSGGEARLDSLVVAATSNARTWNFEGAKPRLNLSMRPSTAVYGRSVKVRTRIISEERGERTVTIERKTKAGAVEVQKIALADGKDSFSMPARVSGRYRLSVEPTALSEGATSAWKRLRVPSKVTASASRRFVQKGDRFSVSGSIAPDATGTVTVQRLVAGRWTKAATSRWSGGRYTVRLRATTLGEQVYRVRTSRTASNEAGTSGRMRVSVTAPPPSTGGDSDGGDGGSGGGGSDSGGGSEPPEGPQRPVA